MNKKYGKNALKIVDKTRLINKNVHRSRKNIDITR